MTPAALAATHKAAFAGAGWPETDFERYLGDKTAFIAGNDTCFALFRVIGPEAEVLTLATHPDVQGRGHATKMLTNALAQLAQKGVEKVFLDVSEQNTAALALYRRVGFVAFSERAQYYANGAAAICMKRTFP